METLTNLVLVGEETNVKVEGCVVLGISNVHVAS